MAWTKRSDLVGGTAVAVVAMGLYVATLQPGFGGPEDTPKFQFLGYVLGTAHPPGYPLYVMLSHLFVQLPLGTVAYRANLFSAAMAALGCGLAYGIARELSSRRLIAAAAAVGLASGASFWRSAVFAEVYSLAAVCVAASTLLLLRWGRRGNSATLLGAVAVFAAGLGNHLTIVSTVPAAVLYAIATNRAAITARVLAAAALICALGLAQYGFIMVRTRHGASYLESRADSARELIGIIRADRFSEQRFAFRPSEVLRTKMPAVVRVIAVELMFPGLACLLAGIVATILRRSARAALVLGSAAGMFVMVANMSGDLKGFITPIVILLWPLAAFGLESACRLFASRQGTAKLAGPVTTAVALAMPVVTVTANYREADQSGQTEIADFIRSTYAHLPDRAAIVAEDYFYDMAHEYFTATHEAGPDRGVGKVGYSAEQVRAARAEGRRVFAFAGAASILAAEGLWFERTALNVDPLDSWLTGLPQGTLLVGAAASAAVPFDPASVGHAAARGVGRAAPFEAFVLAVGKDGAAWRRDEHRASVMPQAAGLSALAGVEARADAAGATVISTGRLLATIPSGVVLVAFKPDGTLWRSLEFTPDDSKQVDAAGTIYELKGEAACVRLRKDEWQEIGDVLSTASAVTTLAEFGTAAIEMELPGGTARASASHLLGDGTTTLEQREGAGALIVEWRFSRDGGRRPLFRLALDQPANAGRARLAAGSQIAAATLCSHRPWRSLASGETTRIHLNPDFESEAFFGAGWTGARRDPHGTARRGESGATLLLPWNPAVPYRATLALGLESQGSIDVLLNGSQIGTCRGADGVVCTVVVPARASAQRESVLRFVMTEPGISRIFTLYGIWFDPVSGGGP